MPESVGLAWYTTGTVALTQGSTAVIGVGTNWKNAGLKVGDIFTIDRVTLYMIASVNTNTSITLAQAYAGTSGNTMNYYVIRNFAATLQAELAAQVSQLVGVYEEWRDGRVNEIAIPFDFSSLYKGVWATGRSYKALDIVMYNSALYVCLVANTSASGNTPGTSGGLHYWGSYAPAMPASIDVLNYNSAASHNAFYRGKNLGSTITAGQSAAIRNGTYTDIYPGDFWEAAVPAYTWTDSNGTVHQESAGSNQYTWLIMGCHSFDCKNGVNTGVTGNHVVVMPSTGIVGGRLNDVNSTAGGYANSEAFKNVIPRCEAMIKAIFGEEHILPHFDFLCNAATNGLETGFSAYSNRLCDLPSVEMVFGLIANNRENKTSHDGSIIQFPAFALNPALAVAGGNHQWLRDVADTTHYMCISLNGGYTPLASSHPSYAIFRPFFLLY